MTLGALRASVGVFWGRGACFACFRAVGGRLRYDVRRKNGLFSAFGFWGVRLCALAGFVPF